MVQANDTFVEIKMCLYQKERKKGKKEHEGRNRDKDRKKELHYGRKGEEIKDRKHAEK